MVSLWSKVTEIVSDKVFIVSPCKTVQMFIHTGSDFLSTGKAQAISE